MSSQLGFSKWDVQIGRQFGRNQYDCVHDITGALARSIDRVRMASLVFTDSVATEDNLAASAWLRNFRSIFDSVEKSHQVTMLLMVLSNAVSTATPLPPFLRVPDPFVLSYGLEKIDKDVLDVGNASEPGLATFAAIQVEIQYIHRCLAELLAAVKDLVGELDVGVAV